MKSFISEPDQPKYLARHRIGERYDLRHDTADKIPLPGGMRNARTLSDLAAVYESSPEELARLNNLDAYELLDDGMLVAVPDPTFRYWLARQFSAELLVNPQDQPYRQRATLMRQLIPVVADDASALDTLLARSLLLTAVEPLSAGIVNELSAALTADSVPNLRHVPALFPGEANESR